MIACEIGHYEIVKLLIERNCQMEEKNQKGSNSFMIACENGHHEVVKLLN